MHCSKHARYYDYSEDMVRRNCTVGACSFAAARLGCGARRARYNGKRNPIHRLIRHPHSNRSPPPSIAEAGDSGCV